MDTSQEKREIIDASEFLRNLQISDSDKIILIRIIAEVMATTAREAVHKITAACMGLDPDGEEFNAFYTNEIREFIDKATDQDTLYNDIVKSLKLDLGKGDKDGDTN